MRPAILIPLLVWSGRLLLGWAASGSAAESNVATRGAEPDGVRELAKVEAQERMRVVDEGYRGISTARRLLVEKKSEEANRLLADLENRSPDLFLTVQIYRTQAMAAMAQTNKAAALTAYQKIFDVVLEPKAPPEEVSKVGWVVLNTFKNEYSGMLLHFKLPPPSAELRKSITDAAKSFGDEPGKPKQRVKLEEADEQRERAQTLIKAGKRAEGLEAYRVLFDNYPEFLSKDGVIINTRMVYIKAHDYPRHSPEHIALLEKLYADPAFQNQPRIANVGVHLGHAYMVKRHPRESAHWKQLVEQIERFQKQPGLKSDVTQLLRENYEGALMNFAEALSRQNELEPLGAVVQKLEANFGGGEGGITARRLKVKLGPVAK